MVVVVGKGGDLVRGVEGKVVWLGLDEILFLWVFWGELVEFEGVREDVLVGWVGEVIGFGGSVKVEFFGGEEEGV